MCFVDGHSNWLLFSEMNFPILFWLSIQLHINFVLSYTSIHPLILFSTSNEVKIFFIYLCFAFDFVFLGFVPNLQHFHWSLRSSRIFTCDVTDQVAPVQKLHHSIILKSMCSSSAGN